MSEEGESSSATVENKTDVLCFCNKPAKLRKSWTNENPRRRFYGCPGFKRSNVHCQFFAWHDLERVSGWQKIALIEARDEIRDKKAEINGLSRIINELREENRRLCGMRENNDFHMELEALEDEIKNAKDGWKMLRLENRKLEKKCSKLEDKNGVLRVLLISSWILFMGFSVMAVYFVYKWLCM